MTKDITKLIKDGYTKGPDACPFISLFEYGILTTEPEDGSIEVIYGVEMDDGGMHCKFLEASFDIDELTLEHFDWVEAFNDELKVLEKSPEFLYHIHTIHSHLDVYGQDYYNYPFNVTNG